MCITHYPDVFPSTLVSYKKTPVFTEQTLPAGLRKDHSTKANVWAQVHVLEGQLRYVVPAWQYDQVLSAGQSGIIAPQVLHYVEPVGTVKLQVEFFTDPLPT